VATDVAARGIDVEDVTHVVNYQCPEDEKMYLHRTGRTGRAGHAGTAVTFVDWDDVPRWGLIDKALELGIPAPVETYSSSPHVAADLDIPDGVNGRLPKSQRVREGLGAEVLEDLGETGKRGGHDDHGKRGGGHDDHGSRDGRGAGKGRSDHGRDERHGHGGEGHGSADGSGRRRPTDATAPDAVAKVPADRPAATGPAGGEGAGERPEGAARRRPRNRRRTRGGHGADSATPAAPASAPTSTD